MERRALTQREFEERLCGFLDELMKEYELGGGSCTMEVKLRFQGDGGRGYMEYKDVVAAIFGESPGYVERVYEANGGSK